jgi:preprotein translocase subunit YajC
MVNNISIEAMRDDEVLFITERYKSLSKNYIKLLHLFTLVIGLGMVLLIIGRQREAMQYNDTLKKEAYFSIVGSSLITWLVIVVGVYFIMVYRYYMDFKKKQKIIEPILVQYKHILDVKGIPKNYVCIGHFKHKVIEVTPNDYAIINIGDEINIEYARYSKEFFSYF